MADCEVVERKLKLKVHYLKVKADREKAWNLFINREKVLILVIYLFFRRTKLIKNFRKFRKATEKLRKPQGTFENFWKDRSIVVLRTSENFHENVHYLRNAMPIFNPTSLSSSRFSFGNYLHG